MVGFRHELESYWKASLLVDSGTPLCEVHLAIHLTLLDLCPWPHVELNWDQSQTVWFKGLNNEYLSDLRSQFKINQ